jgi:hypothetical protein
MDFSRKMEIEKNIIVNPGEDFSYGVTKKEGKPTRGWLKVSNGNLVRFYVLPTSNGEIHPDVITLIKSIQRDHSNGHTAKYYWHKLKGTKVRWVDVGRQERLEEESLQIFIDNEFEF